MTNEERQQAASMTISEQDILPTQKMQQMAAQEESKRQSYSTSSLAAPAHSKNENIVRAILSLVKDLNEQSLETIKRDIDRKMNMH